MAPPFRRQPLKAIAFDIISWAPSADNASPDYLVLSPSPPFLDLPAVLSLGLPLKCQLSPNFWVHFLCWTSPLSNPQRWDHLPSLVPPLTSPPTPEFKLPVRPFHLEFPEEQGDAF